MSLRPLVVLGDALLDRDIVGRVERLAPDAPVPVVDQAADLARPGGAGLAALLARSDGRDVTLITALAPDAAGRRLAELLAAAGVEVIDLGLTGSTPEKLRIRADGRSLLRLDRGGAPPAAVGRLTGAARVALAGAAGVLVADYGRGVASRLRDLPHRAPGVWDPHPRGPQPPPGVTLASPNATEAAHFCPGVAGDGLAARTERARRLRRAWVAGAVTVTLSERGALLVTDDDAPPLVVPAPAVHCVDACGAGDRFASTAAGLLADGALPSEAVTGAVAASSAFVAAGGAAAVRVARRPERPELGGRDQPAADVGGSDAAAVLRRVRAGGGTVVATGGCFDLLHAGHVSVLRAARSLGDCLIVLLNSDESVRRLKGPGRPRVRAVDRAAVLSALECVDAVVEFTADTPTATLARLRPDIWAKGGDYALADLPEAAVLAGWGGQAVVLPYLPGRSTTSMLHPTTTEEAAHRG